MSTIVGLAAFRGATLPARALGRRLDANEDWALKAPTPTRLATTMPTRESRTMRLLVMASVPKKRRRRWLISSNICLPPFGSINSLCIVLCSLVKNILTRFDRINCTDAHYTTRGERNLLD